MRCALGLPSGRFKKKRCLRSRTIFKMFAKNSSQTSQVRSRSALGSRCSLNMTIKRYKSKQSANDYATSNFTTTVTVLEIHNNMWKSFFFTVFSSRIHWATRKHCWIFHGFVYYDATNVNFTENPLTSPEFEQTESLLSQWHLPWFQNALQCTIFHLTDVPDFHEEKFYFAARKTEWDNVAYASIHPFSMIQSSTLALTPLPDSSNHLFSLFSFSLCFSVFSRGAKVSGAMNYNSVGQ